MIDRVCLECGAPAETQGSHWMDSTGFGYDGDERLWLDRILCAAGHRYDQVNEAKTVKL